MNERRKIAVLFHANLKDCKGQTNATLDRIKNLREIIPDTISLEAICTSYSYSKLLKILRGLPFHKKISSTILKGIPIHVEWRKFSLIDYILKIKLHREPLFFKARIKKVLNKLRGFDLISVHSFLAGEIALELYKKYQVPYCITWHGSDIHSIPFESKYLHRRIKEIIENATMNFFVSNALLEKSEEITKLGNKSVLYNGYSDGFLSYTKTKKLELRGKWAFNPNNIIVAFVGNLIPIKNVSLLPPIFNAIKNKIRSDIEFWIIGEGPLREDIIENLDKFNIKSSVKFFGNVSHQEMPNLMNCIDLLILPSINEGLPLVTVEALRCGAKVIGSDVGGISEAIGKENTVKLGEDFVNRFSDKCATALEDEYNVCINLDLDWHKTAQKELDYYINFFNK